MKKIVLAFLTGAFFNASAQITLTESDAPSIGDSIFEIVDTVLSGVTAGPIGENVVWDYTMLGNSYIDTTVFVDPSTVDVNNEFPTANLASVTSQDTSFMSKGSEGLALLGIYAGGLQMKLDNPFYFMKFPFTYGSTLCDTLSFTVTIPYDTTVSGLQIDSVRMTMTVIEHDTAVAYGTVKVTGETFDNTLIIKGVGDNHQVVSIHTTFGWMDVRDTTYVTVNYNAYINGYGAAVLSLSMNDDGTVKSATYKYNQTAANGIVYAEEIAKIYPNPASKTIHLENANKANVEIYNVNGKIVKRASHIGRNASLDISDLTAGTYIIKVKEGNKIKTAKLNVVR
jgi:hypothetical protein